MAEAPVTGRGPDYGDVQGLVRFGHGRMKQASYALLRVRSVEAARAWLGSVPVTTAVATSAPPPTAVQVAFTAAGLEALGVPAAVRAGFSPEFLGGMAEESRSRRLGDVGENAPSRWEWGSAGAAPHVLVMLFAEPGRLEALVRSVTGTPWRDAFEALRWLESEDLRAAEPFGFTDGISQPEVDWREERDAAAASVECRNVVALGEFLLGYRNEYGRYTDRPLLDASEPAAAGLPPAEDAPDRRDLGRNGTYLVLRQLRQDVRGFWRFLLAQSGGNLAEAEALGAEFVGRRRNGEPLALDGSGDAGSGPDAVRLNRFTYDGDPGGVRCPIGAHVRRANPRNADYVGHPSALGRILADLGFGRRGLEDDLTSSVRFHRILRRGRAYGPWLPPESAMAPAPPDDPERGLHFACLNANICRQFEFVQNAWMASTKFSGLTGESDPLTGNREPIPGCPATDAFTLPQEAGLPRRVTGLPRFVAVRGGAYFFLPGLRALRYIAGAP
ncbi:MAG TPA: peroxidase [Vicinamibacteria bacterium]|nr:peroxidase [Vicinamibacteria bacterium]